MKRVVAGIAALGTAVGLLGGLACGDGDTVSEPEDDVRIDSISPSSGTIRTELTIRGRGFDAANNDIGFTPLNGDSQNGGTGFETGVPSADGRALRFVLADVLGICAMSQLDPGVACPDIGFVLPVGEINVSVHNGEGNSNGVVFNREISEFEAATEKIHGSPDYDEMRDFLDELVLNSYQPSTGLYLSRFSIGIEWPTGSELYVEVSVGGVQLSAIEDRIPDEIAGYEVRTRQLANFP